MTHGRQEVALHPVRFLGGIPGLREIIRDAADDHFSDLRSLVDEDWLRATQAQLTDGAADLRIGEDLDELADGIGPEECIGIGEDQDLAPGADLDTVLVNSAAPLAPEA